MQRLPCLPLSFEQTGVLESARRDRGHDVNESGVVMFEFATQPRQHDHPDDLMIEMHGGGHQHFMSVRAGSYVRLLQGKRWLGSVDRISGPRRLAGDRETVLSRRLLHVCILWVVSHRSRGC